jgi:hypothetical protein
MRRCWNGFGGSGRGAAGRMGHPGCGRSCGCPWVLHRGLPPPPPGVGPHQPRLPHQPRSGACGCTAPHKPAAPPTPGVPHTSGRSPPRSSEPVPAAPHPPAVCDSAHASATRSTRWGRRPAPGTSGPPDDEPSPAPTGPNASRAWTRSCERRRQPLAPGAPMKSHRLHGEGPDLPLFPQDPVLPPQPPQLLPLRGHKPVATKPRVQLRLLHPRAQGPVSDAKLPGDLRDGPARAPDQPDCLLPEFPGVRGSAPRHRELLSEAVASSLSLSTKPGQVHPPSALQPLPRADERWRFFRWRKLASRA